MAQSTYNIGLVRERSRTHSRLRRTGFCMTSGDLHSMLLDWRASKLPASSICFPTSGEDPPRARSAVSGHAKAVDERVRSESSDSRQRRAVFGRLGTTDGRRRTVPSASRPDAMIASRLWQTAASARRWLCSRRAESRRCASRMTCPSMHWSCTGPSCFQPRSRRLSPCIQRTARRSASEVRDFPARPQARSREAFGRADG